jgi:hypothetical protein
MMKLPNSLEFRSEVFVNGLSLESEWELGKGIPDLQSKPGMLKLIGCK